MTTTLRDGHRKWKLVRDERGHRDYTLTLRVYTSTARDGPANVIRTPGLPLPGSLWQVDDDLDIYAWCRQNATVTPVVDNVPNREWDVEFNFSTKPDSRCNDTDVEDPLLEPPKISGNFTRFQEEATQDRFGRSVFNSAWEQIRGPQVEFDRSRLTITIEQNVPTFRLALQLPGEMMDKVNEQPLWGLPPRTIKLSNCSWSAKYQGHCFQFYGRTLTFEVRHDTFDRVILDEGTKVLKGTWNTTNQTYEVADINGSPANPLNPLHFIRFQDVNGNIARVILDGAGRPFQPVTRDPIFTCEECPDGAPRTWRLVGPEEEVTLTYTSGCSWSGVTDSASTSYTLEADPDNEVWVLSAFAGIGTAVETQWEAPTQNWLCFGPNLMANVDGDEPEVVTLIAGNQPGQFLLQKYLEADFLQLGIPVVL